MKGSIRVLGLVLTGALVAHASGAWAGDSDFLDFVVKQAHRWKFDKCDEGLRKAFENVSGKDINVLSHSHPRAKDTLKLSAVWGSPGDMVYKSVVMRKTSAGCLAEQTSLIHTVKSCAEYLRSDVPAFRVVKEMGGVVFAKNPGGVDLILVPAGQDRCTALFEVNQTL